MMGQEETIRLLQECDAGVQTVSYTHLIFDKDLNYTITTHSGVTL